MLFISLVGRQGENKMFGFYSTFLGRENHQN
jgi:hypothetical protein